MSKSLDELLAGGSGRRITLEELKQRKLDREAASLRDEGSNSREQRSLEELNKLYGGRTLSPEEVAQLKSTATEYGVSHESPSISDKLQAGGYGFAKGVGKTIDSTAAAGNAIYGATMGGLKNASSVIGADNLSNIFANEQDIAYQDANNLWNNKVAEKYATDELKPDSVKRFENTEHKGTIENYEAGGHAVASLIEMAAGGRVLRLAGSGITAISSKAIANTKVSGAIKNLPSTINNSSALSWINTLVKVPLNKTTIGGSAVGGVLADKFRSDDLNERANHPYQDLSRSTAGFIIGDLSARGVAKGMYNASGKVLMQADSLVKSTLSETAYNNLINGTKPKLDSFMNSFKQVQTSVGNLVNGTILNVSTPSGKAATRVVKNIEEGAKDSIKYSADNSFIKSDTNPFAIWLLGRKGVNLDMDFIESVSPELKTLIANKGDEKAIYKELLKNKDLLNVFTIQKDNQKALDIAMYLPEYILQEKVLKNAKGDLASRLKNTFGNYMDSSEFPAEMYDATSTIKEALPKYNELLTRQSNIYKQAYKELLASELKDNPDFVYNVKLDGFSKELNMFNDYLAGFQSELKTDRNLAYTSRIFNELSYNAKNNIPIEPNLLIDAREFLLEAKNSSKIDRWNAKAIGIIDEIMANNTDNLPTDFNQLYRRSLDFDANVYNSFIQSEIVKTIMQGEQSNYLSSVMSTSKGVRDVKEALYFGKYDKFHKDSFKPSTDLKTLSKTDVKISDIFNISTNTAVEKTIASTKPQIQTLKGESKEVFNSLCNTKLRELILNDFIQYERSGGKFDWSSIATRDTLLNNRELFLELMPNQTRKQAEVIVDKFPIIFNKVGELAEKIKQNPNSLKGWKQNESLLTSLKNSGILGSIVGGATGAFSGTHTGITAGTATAVSVTGGKYIYGALSRKLYEGAANSLEKPETTMRLIELAQKNQETNFLRYLLKLSKPTVSNQVIPRSMYNNISNEDTNPNIKQGANNFLSNTKDFLTKGDVFYSNPYTRRKMQELKEQKQILGE